MPSIVYYFMQVKQNRTKVRDMQGPYEGHVQALGEAAQSPWGRAVEAHLQGKRKASYTAIMFNVISFVHVHVCPIIFTSCCIWSSRSRTGVLFRLTLDTVWFEGYLRNLTKLFHGTKGVPEQIASKFLARNHLTNLECAEDDFSIPVWEFLMKALNKYVYV